MDRKIFAAAMTAAMLCAGAIAADEGPGVSVTVDRRSIHIGDRIRYVIEARTDGKTEVRFPAFKDDKLGDFEIRASGTKSAKRLFGGSLLSGWYDISCFSVGKRTIPPVEIKYRPKGAKDWVARKVRAIDIVVESILATAGRVDDIKDIKGPLSFIEINLLVIFGVLLILFSSAAIILAYRMLRKKRPKKTSYEIAVDDLTSISGVFSRGGDIKGYYVGISDCVRRYIESVFKLKAPEMTTEEFLGSLKNSASLSSVHKELLEGFLGACDLVKFARYAPTKKEAESVFTTAKTFIEETKNMLNDEGKVKKA